MRKDPGFGPDVAPQLFLFAIKMIFSCACFLIDLKALRSLRFEQVNTHCLLRRIGIVLANGAVDIAVLFGGSIQVSRPLYDLAPVIEKNGGHHIHKCREDTVSGSSRYRLVKLYVMNQVLLRPVE